MAKRKVKLQPKKSLRTLLVVWFLLFSVVPLAFITGYSLVKFEQAIDQELSQRLRGNAREIEVILSDFQSNLMADLRAHASDNTLVYYLSTRNASKARELAQRWMKSGLAQRMSIFGRTGCADVVLYRDQGGQVQRQENLEKGDFCLAENFLGNMNEKDEMTIIDLVEKKTARRGEQGRVELVVFRKVKSSSGLVVGYIEEVISFDEGVISGLKNRMNIELFFFDPRKEPIVSSHEDLSAYKSSFFTKYLNDLTVEFFDINLREVPFRFMLAPLKWGDTELVLGLGASKSTAKAVLKNVNYAFFSVVATVIFLLIVLSFIASKILLRPLYEILDAIEKVDFDREIIRVPETNETELGLLSQSFNEMSEHVYSSQKALKEKISELENANSEIRETQTKLVHTAKMASLGQLVAGIAHELNNPIGFIYSNMSHLRDYSDKLVNLVRTAEESPEKLESAKKKADFEYIVNDMPKLISSCEDGARRTRDIVLGLRNFSRLEEAQVKKVDLHEGLDNTLNLLTGELKNRIDVVRDYAKLPKVTCNPSQVNQVFMNILSNAAQAIDGNGQIVITTRAPNKKTVEISIKDSGKGMDRETAEKVFDPFFTTKSVGVGTGLGLSISYGVIQKHGGDIRVKSDMGRGTEFIITLPVNFQEEA